MEMSTCDGSKNAAPQQPCSHTLSSTTWPDKKQHAVFIATPTYRLCVIDGTEQALLLAPTTLDDHRVSTATVRCVFECIISIAITAVVLPARIADEFQIEGRPPVDAHSAAHLRAIHHSETTTR